MLGDSIDLRSVEFRAEEGVLIGGNVKTVGIGTNVRVVTETEA
jgi:hypothetical protein